MRRPLIAGNWKLNLGPEEARSLANALRAKVVPGAAYDVAVFPTTLSVMAVVQALAGTEIDVGLQDIHTEPDGAFTGANSAHMARAAGCTRTLVGHSERRTLFGEASALCGDKVRAALEAGLLPVLCVGETLEQRDRGEVEAVIEAQLSEGLAHVTQDQASSVTLAYEPVWAIGTGRTASPEQAQAVHSFIRTWLAARFGPAIAQDTRILYGGSVKAGNAAELLSCADIDGALVGGASLDADAFSGILAACA